MARDNSPEIRQRAQLERKQNRRASYDRILIVSEGSKTEPNYFREIQAALRLHTANVQVRLSEPGTEPTQVVQYARDLFEQGDNHKGIRKRSFEKVFAVFDRDDHKSYFEALKLAASLDKKLRNDDKQPVVFRAIASIPSFELWLLLHYEDILHPLHRDEVMLRLKKYIPGYEKGMDKIFLNTRDKLDIASSRARKPAKNNTAFDGEKPFTDIEQLVDLLNSLGRQHQLR